MRFQKILCPVDFSTGSDHALRLAVMLARTSSAELVIAHAWYVPDLVYATGDWVVSPDVVARIVDDDRVGLAASETRARELGAPHVSTLLLNGAPGYQIVGALEGGAFDLVVVGTHGESGLKRVLLGSVAEHVVRHAPCAVLVARERLDDTPFRNVLCPVDFSERSIAAAELAADVAEPGGRGITLFHAIELPSAYARDSASADAVVELDRKATRELEQLTAQIRSRAKVPVTAQTCIGRAGAEILRAVDSAVYDLVVIGSHGRTGIGQALVGSVAEKVVRHAWCPVLVAPKP